MPFTTHLGLTKSNGSSCGLISSTPVLQQYLCSFHISLVPALQGTNATMQQNNAHVHNESHSCNNASRNCWSLTSPSTTQTHSYSVRALVLNVHVRSLSQPLPPSHPQKTCKRINVCCLRVLFALLRAFALNFSIVHWKKKLSAATILCHVYWRDEHKNMCAVCSLLMECVAE